MAVRVELQIVRLVGIADDLGRHVLVRDAQLLEHPEAARGPGQRGSVELDHGGLLRVGRRRRQRRATAREEPVARRVDPEQDGSGERVGPCRARRRCAPCEHAAQQSDHPAQRPEQEQRGAHAREAGGRARIERPDAQVAQHSDSRSEKVPTAAISESSASTKPATACCASYQGPAAGKHARSASSSASSATNAAHRPERAARPRHARPRMLRSARSSARARRRSRACRRPRCSVRAKWSRWSITASPNALAREGALLELARSPRAACAARCGRSRRGVDVALEGRARARACARCRRGRRRAAPRRRDTGSRRRRGCGTRRAATGRRRRRGSPPCGCRSSRRCRSARTCRRGSACRSSRSGAKNQRELARVREQAAEEVAEQSAARAPACPRAARSPANAGCVGSLQRLAWMCRLLPASDSSNFAMNVSDAAARARRSPWPRACRSRGGRPSRAPSA